MVKVNTQPVLGGRLWSPEELEKLKNAVRKDYGFDAIRNLFPDRSEHAVRHKYNVCLKQNQAGVTVRGGNRADDADRAGSKRRAGGASRADVAHDVHNAWSPREIEQLKVALGKGESHHEVHILGRSADAVRNKMNRLVQLPEFQAAVPASHAATAVKSSKNPAPWAAEDDQDLKDAISKGQTWKNVQVPGRSPDAVRHRMDKLMREGITSKASKSPPHWTADEDRKLANALRKNLSKEQLRALFLNRSGDAIRLRIKRLNTMDSGKEPVSDALSSRGELDVEDGSVQESQPNQTLSPADSENPRHSEESLFSQDAEQASKPPVHRNLAGFQPQQVAQFQERPITPPVGLTLVAPFDAQPAENPSFSLGICPVCSRFVPEADLLKHPNHQSKICLRCANRANDENAPMDEDSGDNIQPSTQPSEPVDEDPDDDGVLLEPHWEWAINVGGQGDHWSVEELNFMFPLQRDMADFLALDPRQQAQDAAVPPGGNTVNPFLQDPFVGSNMGAWYSGVPPSVEDHPNLLDGLDFNPLIQDLLVDPFVSANIDTEYRGLAPSVEDHPDLRDGLDFTPTPHHPVTPPGFMTAEQLFADPSVLPSTFMRILPDEDGSNLNGFFQDDSGDWVQSDVDKMLE